MTNVIEQELSAWDDKRRQLAALLLLHCLKKSIGKETEIATKYAGQQPTLIACAACDTIIASTVSDKTQVETVIRILEMWRMNQNIDPIEQVGWQQLHIFMQSSEWRDILPWLETKHVLSTKPLSLKRQTTILETQGSIWMKLILFAILKKGQWTGQEPERQLLKECLGRNEQLSWTDESGWPLLVQLVFAAPHIFENNNEHIHASNGHLVYHLVHRALQLEQYPDSMATYMMQQPAYATKALVQGIKEDNRRSLELTGALVRQVTTSKDAFEIGSMFIKELLPLVSRSHTACEALITCMDITGELLTPPNQCYTALLLNHAEFRYSLTHFEIDGNDEHFRYTHQQCMQRTYRQGTALQSLGGWIRGASHYRYGPRFQTHATFHHGMGQDGYQLAGSVIGKLQERRDWVAYRPTSI